MTASLTILCPNCSASLKLKNSKLVGREVPCPKCQKRFVVAAPESPKSDEWDFSAVHHEDESSDEIANRPGTPARARTANEARKEAAANKKTTIKPGWIVAGVMLLVCAVTIGFVVSSSLGSRGTDDSKAPADSAKSAESADLQKTDAAPVVAGIVRSGDNRPADAAKSEVPAMTASAATNDDAAAQRAAKFEAMKAELAAKNAASPAAKPIEIAKAAPASIAAAPASASGGSLVGRTIPEFSASAIDNTTYHSKDHKENVLVVAFMGVQCPLANLYYPNLVSLAAKFSGQPVAFIIVNSNEQDTLNAVREQATMHQAKFTVLKDAGNQVADAFGAERTPELFILDEARTVRYHGQIDDQYGYQSRRKSPTKSYAGDAIQELLSGGNVALAETPLQGCHIGRKGKSAEKTETSFYRDVLPILQDRCQQCHRAGDIGPFALEDYASSSNWGETIKEAVVERRMPPWPADPAHGEFLNNRRLPDAELKTLVKWVDEGCPEGNVADKPPAKDFVEGWNIGQPDQEFAMEKPYEVAATGVVDYQHFVISPVFTKDVWVQAVECKYGNRAVVHHMLALLHFPKDQSRSQDGLKNGYFAAGAPGSNYLVFPTGHAKRIPKGAQLVLQMHYTPNGSAAQDQSRLGIVLAKQPIDFEVLTYAVGTEDILVKAGDANYKKSYSEPIEQDVTLTTLMPHLHVRGKSFDIQATTPDGKTEKLISIPKWDFNWQYQYQLVEPITLPKGSKLTVTATWDNSEKNPNNILPPVDVRFGEQTFDEMFIGYVNYAIPRKSGSKGKGAARTRG